MQRRRELQRTRLLCRVRCGVALMLETFELDTLYMTSQHVLHETIQ